MRSVILKSFCSQLNLSRLSIDHTTYHHFLGNGASDSEIDVIIYSKSANEVLIKILCKLASPDHASHHDALISEFLLAESSSPPLKADCPSAPRICNDRVKIYWTESGILDYESYVSTSLRRLRDNWLNPHSVGSTSILLASTNSIPQSWAMATNPSKDLSLPFNPKPKKKEVCYDHIR